MRIDFDMDTIRSHKITLLESQVDLMLRSLEFYVYTYRYIYPRRKSPETKEESLRISLVEYTYNQILSEYGKSKNENPIIENTDINSDNYDFRLRAM